MPAKKRIKLATLNEDPQASNAVPASSSGDAKEEWDGWEEPKCEDLPGPQDQAGQVLPAATKEEVPAYHEFICLDRFSPNCQKFDEV